ncbi:MAG: PPC domain-containing protein [Planctomycetales bacterium]|nr:PPC domain-containing protein [Planctomycetales bacterium]
MKANRALAPLAVLLSLLAVGQLAAQLPATRLDGIFPPAAAPGQTLELTLFGADLDDVDKLHFSHPGITAAQKQADPRPFDEGQQPVENVFVVTVKGGVPPGHHSVRCQGKYGLSNPRTFVVDSSPAVAETEPNNELEQATEIEALPAAVNGQLNGGADIDWYKFTGQAGQRLLIDGLARRIDSRADAVVTLTAADGRILAASRQARAGDPFIDVVLPASGVYFVKVHESLYAGGGDYPYRLTIDSRPVVDFVFPPAGLPGSNDEYTIYGRNLPGGKVTDLTREGRPLEQLTVRIPLPADAVDQLRFSERLDPHQFSIDGVEYRVNSPSGPSNPALVTVATAPVVREQDNNDSPQAAQQLTIPCEVAGQFYPQRDVDWYTFDAKAGDDFWIEVYSHRLGVPTDPLLVVLRVEKNEAGEEKITQLGWVDDGGRREGGHEFDERSHDPLFHFSAPADGTYRVLVRDGYATLVSDPRLVYRLAIRQAKPDFRLAAVPTDSSGAVFLRKGGREAIRVIAYRQDGFDGEIRVSASGLPGGVTASEFVIGPASFVGTLVLSADANAPGGIGQLRVTGKATVGGAEVTRVARPAHPLQPVPFAQPNNPGQPSLTGRLAADLPVVVSEGETARVVMKLEDPAVVETARGGVVKFKYSVTRQDGAGGNINGFPIGLPPNMGVPQVGIGGNASGEFELRLQANTPPGAYSFCLAGMLQGMNYSRNPEAAEQAKQRQERINKIFTDSQQKVTAAQQAAQKAQNDLNQANAEVNQATTAKSQADQLSSNAANAAKAAADALTAALQQSDAKPDDAGLKQQFEAARTKSDEEAKKAKDASDAAAVAAKKLEEAMAKQKATQEAKTKADQDVQAAQQFQQQAQQEKQRTDQRAQQLQQQANLRGFNLIIPSTPVTLRIAEYPITLTSPEKAAVKQGEKVDIPLKIERLYGFDQQVNTQLIVPGGVGGLQIQNLNIAQNQTDGPVVVTAQPTATPGDHSLTLRVTMNFNGQGLTLDRQVVLTVEKVEAKQ